jgi:hypothetical protein
MPVIKLAQLRLFEMLSAGKRASGVFPVPNHRLAGRFILLIEDEPLIALDVERVLRAAGAKILAAGYLESALYTTEHPAI